MADPAYTPHRFAVARPRRPGEPLSGFGTPDPTEWTLPRGETAEHLRDAVLHHLLVLGLRRATARTGTPAEDFAEAAGRGRQEWTRVLAGQVPMKLTDAAAVALAGPEALPDGRAAFGLLAAVSRDADDELAARIAAAAGDPRALDDRDVQRALEAPLVQAQRPLSPDARRGVRDAHRGLQGFLDATTRGLAAARGRPGDAGADPEVDVDAVHPGEHPGAAGYAAGPRSLVSLAVRPDWARMVQGPGWALLDGRLVLDVVLPGPDGRPAIVRVLDLIPDWNGPARDDGTPPPWGWAYRASLATVTWDGDGPTVTVSDPFG